MNTPQPQTQPHPLPSEPPRPAASVPRDTGAAHGGGLRFAVRNPALKKWAAGLLALSVLAGCRGTETEWVRKGAALADEMRVQSMDALLSRAASLAGGAENAVPDTAKRTSAPGRYSGRVTRVSDGDTLRVTDRDGRSRKVRLAYIDAPELQQAYGQAARDALAQAAQDAAVEVAVFETDRYGREIAKVTLGGEDLNLAQIRRGAAWHYAAYARKQSAADRSAYAEAMDDARNSRRGLWKQRDAQAPWTFRKTRRAQQESRNRSSTDSGWPQWW